MEPTINWVPSNSERSLDVGQTPAFGTLGPTQTCQHLLIPAVLTVGQGVGSGPGTVWEALGTASRCEVSAPSRSGAGAGWACQAQTSQVPLSPSSKGAEALGGRVTQSAASQQPGFHWGGDLTVPVPHTHTPVWLQLLAGLVPVPVWSKPVAFAPPDQLPHHAPRYCPGAQRVLGISGGFAGL